MSDKKHLLIWRPEGWREIELQSEQAIKLRNMEFKYDPEQTLETHQAIWVAIDDPSISLRALYFGYEGGFKWVLNWGDKHIAFTSKEKDGNDLSRALFEGETIVEIIGNIGIRVAEIAEEYRFEDAADAENVLALISASMDGFTLRTKEQQAGTGTGRVAFSEKLMARIENGELF